MLESVFEDPSLVRRPTTLFVDLGILRLNLKEIRTIVGPHRQILAIVKANAYGHGLVTVAKTFLNAGADRLGVAYLEEGIALRRAGILAPILVMGGIFGDQVQHFIENDLEITAASAFKLQQIESAAKSLGKIAKVHLKFDTGMERIGVHWDNAETLLKAALNVRYTEVIGLFSHLAESEAEDTRFTELQIERFDNIVHKAKSFGLNSPLLHIANSGGILYHPASWYNTVRPGLALYGVEPRNLPSNLQTALRLESKVVYFKVVREGCSVSYNRTWTASRDTRVVTIPIGYGDGYPRRSMNEIAMIVNGRKCLAIGRVTMDATMIDIGHDGTAYNGDTVILLGRSKNLEITIQDISKWMGTIPYEVMTSLNTRIPRVYLS